MIEKELRGPKWNEATGVWIALNDDQLWLFPKPWVRFYPAVDAEGKPTLGTKTSLGASFDAAVSMIRQANDDDNNYAALVGQLALGRAMLEVNYDIPADAWQDVLNYDPDDQANAEMWGQILDVALGRDAPKASTVGVD